MQGSKRLSQLGSYAFQAIDEKVQLLRDKGLQPIDFGVGDPTAPTPALIREAAQRGIDTYRSAGYPPYLGTAEFRAEVARWSRNRFGIDLDPAREIIATIGSKEAIFHFPEAILDPGDLVICPDPGYPPYERGTLFAEGGIYHTEIRAENRYLPDLDSIPEEVASRAKIFWLTHPNSPTGRVAPPAYLEEWIEYCRKWDIVAASDEAYTEIYFGEQPPASALEFGREGVVVFQSLSKRSAMTGYRIGWCAGDAELISLFGKVKTNVDSGAPFFVQAAAIAALGDETHVAEFRAEYRQKRDLLVEAFEAAGLPRCEPEAALYLWQRAPEGLDGVTFAELLLDPEIAAVTLPGSALGQTEAGRHYVRLALVPSVAECEQVASRIKTRLPELIRP